MPVQPEPFAVAFGTAVRKARVARGLSQEELASKAQFRRTYIADIEHGRRNLTLRNIVRVAVALEVTLSDLVGEIDVSHAP